MKKHLFALLLLLVTALALPASGEEKITSLSQLNAHGMVVGISQGSAAELAVENELPEAGVAYFLDNNTAYLAVAQGKIDAYIYDLSQMRIALEQGLTGVRLLPETLAETVQVAAGISPVSQIPDLEGKLNQFIRQLRADGTLEDMRSRWVMNGNETMPDIPAPENPSLHLTVGTTGIVPPYSYYVGTQLSGFDIELAYRFASWLGADVQFKVYDYGAIIPAALTGSVDCVMANLNITPERQEALTFSELLYEEKIGIMVADTAEEAPAAKTAPAKQESAHAWEAYNGKRIGVLTGPLMEDIAHKNFPDSEYMLFNSYPDCITALLAGRIDAYLGDEPGLKSVHAEQPEIDYIHERITNQDYSFAFRKNDPESTALCEELNAFLALSHENGTMQELDDIWFGVDEARKVVDMSDLTGEKGTIRVVTTSTDMPWSYIKDGKNVGYDIDLVVRFCRFAGYRLELGDVDFSARIPAVQSGKFDFTTDMNVTPERMEQVLFSDPTSSGGVVLAILAKDAQQAETADIPSLSSTQWKGKRVGVQTGSVSGDVASAALPDIVLKYFNNQTDILAALKAKKIDAWCGEEPTFRFVSLENKNLVTVGMLDTSSLAAVFPKTEAGKALRDQYSAFVDQLWADGTMEEIDKKWFSGDESQYTVLDYEALPSTNGTLRMALDTTILPFAIMKNGRAMGYDVDIAARFCEKYGYGLKVLLMDFNGVLPALQSKKCDFAACGITVTEERKESVLFSSPTYHSGTALAVLKSQPANADLQPGVYKSLDELDGKRIGVQTGSSFDQSVKQHFPNATVFYYNTRPDMVNALLTQKIDAFAVDEPVMKAQMQQNDQVTSVPEYMDSFEFGCVFPKTEKGQALCDQFNEYLTAITDDGTLSEIEAKWFGDDEEAKTILDYPSFSGENGTLRMATEAMYEPFIYIRDNQVVGYDIDIAVRFCQAYGYGLEIEDMSFDAILPAVQSGKSDFGAAGITITEERMESVLFSAPYFSGGTVLGVLKAESAGPSTADPSPAEKQAPSFWDSIQTSFNKTFIRENRWQLFLEGIGTTTLITVLSILFGTLLGFLLFMLCRNGNPVANGATRFSMWLVQGTPMVVLLMILYYVIFGSVAINGIAVAVIGFTLTFGASVLGLLRMGVGAIDQGQYEAAYALGHSNRHTFFKIILPQAIPHVVPSYQGEIVGLIKATAIVGYIAVQDLTKMGDIVRSRTYEAFFPLIAVTVIYFILEGLFSFAVSRIRIRIDPKKRKKNRILKGVNVHD